MTWGNSLTIYLWVRIELQLSLLLQLSKNNCFFFFKPMIEAIKCSVVYAQIPRPEFETESQIQEQI